MQNLANSWAYSSPQVNGLPKEPTVFRPILVRSEGWWGRSRVWSSAPF